MSNKRKELKRDESRREEKQMLLVLSGQTFLWPLCLVTVESEVVIGASLGCASAACTVTCSFSVEPNCLLSDRNPGTLFSATE